jgi:hypothetical protein
VWQAFLPVGGNPATVLNDGIGVTGQRQGDHIGLQPIDDTTGLFAGAAMALFDGHVLAGLGFPMFGKRGIELGIKFSGRVVRHIKQRHRWLGNGAEGRTGQYGKGSGVEQAAGERVFCGHG